MADSDKPVYTNSQLTRLAAVYDTLARLLPTEGRDYSVSIVFNKDNDGMSLSMEPYTDIGKIWCAYCMNVFRNVGGST